MRIKLSLCLLMLPLSGVFSQSAQFRGENRDGVYYDQGLLTSWPEGGPNCVMTVEGIGKGYSSAVESNGTIYVTGMKDSKDYLTAIGADGKIKWQVPYGTSWTKTFPDTRSTPTVECDRIYVISGTGRIACIDTADGRERWAFEADSIFSSRWHDWGVAESVLLTGDLAVCTPAGDSASVVAFNKMTGEVVWKAKPTEGKTAYSSAVLYEYGGFRYILATTTTELIAVIPETGRIAWIYKHWLADKDPNDEAGQIFCNNPLVNGNEIFLTRGYNYPGIMLTVSPDGKTVTEKWFNDTLDDHHDGVIFYDGSIYGSNWISNGKGNWVCLNWNTGQVRWEQTWFNKGPIILDEGLMYVMDEKAGNVGLVRPDTTKFELVSTFRIDKGSGPYWAHPSIYNGHLLIRHGDVLMVFDIRAKQ
jgi:outer membrane protein assembly factor BamB